MSESGTASVEMQRRAAVQLIARVGLVGAAILAVINLILYFQVGAWQMLFVAGGELVVFTCLLSVVRLERLNKLNLAGYLLIITLLLALGVIDIANEGLTWFLAGSGILAVFLVGSIVLPRMWGIWLGIAFVYAIYFYLVNTGELLPRYNTETLVIYQTSIFFVFGIISLIAIWQFFRTIQLGSIRTRLLIVIVALVLLLVTTISAFSSLLSAQRAQLQVINQLESVATLKYAEIEAWLENLTKVLLLAMPPPDQYDAFEILLIGSSSADPSFYKATYDRELERLRGIVEQASIFESMFWVTTDGSVILSTDPSQVGRIEYGYPYFEQGLLGTYATPPYLSPALDRLTIVVATPLVSKHGETIGILAARADLTRLSDIMLERTGLGASGETYLVGGWDHRLVTESRFSNEGWIAGESYLFSDGINRVAETGKGGSGEYISYRGEPVLGAYLWLPALEIALLAEQSRSEALLATYQTLLASIGVTIGAVFLAVLVALFVTNRITTPIKKLSETAEKIAAGDLYLTADIRQVDEIGALAKSFNVMTNQLRRSVELLEQQVAERTANLEQRRSYMQYSAEVSRAIATILDPDELIQQVVNLIRDRYKLYYVGIFLVDEPGEWAILRAGTGEAGRAMMERNHRIEVGTGMVGWSIANDRPRIALRAEVDAVRLHTPELPDTQAEAALPLRSRGSVIGALTVQSVQPDAFDDAFITILQTLADQVAVALDNARLFRRSQEMVETLGRAYGELTREGWIELLRKSSQLSFSSDVSGRTSVEPRWQIEMKLAAKEGRTIQMRRNEDPSFYVMGMPIKVRENVIGVISGEKSIEDGDWTAEETEFFEEIADMLSVALESARAFQETQLKAERERIASEVTTRIRESLDTESVIKTASDVIRKALGLPEVVIRLSMLDQETTDGGSSHDDG